MMLSLKVLFRSQFYLLIKTYLLIPSSNYSLNVFFVIIVKLICSSLSLKKE